MDIKYPEQVGTIKRKNKVLGVDAKLILPTEREIEESNVAPLEMHSGFSRFILTLLDNVNGVKISPHANIPAREIMYIKQKTDLALHKILEAKLAGGMMNTTGDDEQETKSIAFTQKLMGSTFKGQTPGEILLNNPTQKAALLKQKEWLNQNLAKYAANAYQIKAIDEAIALLDAGKLKGSDAPKTTCGKSFTIYSADHKFFTAKNDKGYNQIYSIDVTCDPTMDYPFIISISNCWAPVEEDTRTGGKNVKMAMAEGKVQSSLKMNEIEWCSLVTRMAQTLENFERINFSDQFILAKKYSWQPKEQETDKR